MPGSNATGLMLALLTALFWGALPLALKHLLSTVDALSIVCLRFWVAAAWTWGLSCRHPGNSTPLGRREKILLVLAAAGLSCNFVFFNTRLLELANGDMLIGMALGIMAAVVWTSYGIAQKVLLRTISPGRIMRFIYLAGALALTPLSTPSAFLELDSLQTACLIFACINTIVAYGAFSTAMKNWHAAKVSAVVTTTPLFTLGLEALGALALPQVFPLEHLGLLSLLGAVVVVLGAMGIALGPMLHLPHKRS